MFLNELMAAASMPFVQVALCVIIGLLVAGVIGTVVVQIVMAVKEMRSTRVH